MRAKHRGAYKESFKSDQQISTTLTILILVAPSSADCQVVTVKMLLPPKSLLGFTYDSGSVQGPNLSSISTNSAFFHLPHLKCAHRQDAYSLFNVFDTSDVCRQTIFALLATHSTLHKSSGGDSKGTSLSTRCNKSAAMPTDLQFGGSILQRHRYVNTPPVTRC